MYRHESDRCRTFPFFFTFFTMKILTCCETCTVGYALLQWPGSELPLQYLCCNYELYTTSECGPCGNSNSSICHSAASGGSPALPGIDIHPNKRSVEGLFPVLLMGFIRRDYSPICTAAALCPASCLNRTWCYFSCVCFCTDVILVVCVFLYRLL